METPHTLAPSRDGRATHFTARRVRRVYARHVTLHDARPSQGVTLMQRPALGEKLSRAHTAGGWE